MPLHALYLFKIDLRDKISNYCPFQRIDEWVFTRGVGAYLILFYLGSALIRGEHLFDGGRLFEGERLIEALRIYFTMTSELYSRVNRPTHQLQGFHLFQVFPETNLT